MLINDRQITITFGESRKSINWKPQILRLSELYDRLKTPVRGTETMNEYLSFKKPQQDALKDVGGFVAGTLNNPRRKRNSVVSRDVITLDLDNIPAGQKDDILRRVESLGCGYCVYSTRKHHPAAPRLRVLLPLDRAATADEYEPISRKAAELIGMQFTDPTTFEAHRLMYYPSCCADGEYVYAFADKPFMSADGMLALYDNWRDVTQWAQTPNSPASIPRLAAKQGDPEEKNGVVGAFCRTYDVYRAIDMFIPGIYEQCDTDESRFTFCEGSTTGGAVVYDNGKFLFSHHATDPCGGKLVNAFDLVRIHMYEDKDDTAAPDTPNNRLPSYIAMCELANADSDIAGLMAKERVNALADFGGLDAEVDNIEWMTNLKTHPQSGAILPTAENCLLILENDLNLKGKFALNTFADRDEVFAYLPWQRRGGKQDKFQKRHWWDDNDTKGLWWYFETYYKITKEKAIDTALSMYNDLYSFDEVAEYLNGLVWDGKPRLENLFIYYLGAEDTEYTRTVTRKALVGAVTRVMEPGCKFDYMTVFVGKTGYGKSTLLDKLSKGWFTDAMRTFEGKEPSEMIQGVWLVEIAEMEALRKTDINRVKQFVTQRYDRFRAAYARFVKDVPRRCVIFGTTNTHDCLTDETGNRRFWVIDIGETTDRETTTNRIKHELDGEVDQIWAEAVVKYKLGEPLYLDSDMEEKAEYEQERHREISAREEIIRNFLDKEVPVDWNSWELDKRRIYWGGGVAETLATEKRTKICAAEIWFEAFNKPLGECDKRQSKEINGVLDAITRTDKTWRRSKTPFRNGAYGLTRGFIREE